jgi:hypothetical protein
MIQLPMQARPVSMWSPAFYPGLGRLSRKGKTETLQLQRGVFTFVHRSKHYWPIAFTSTQHGNTTWQHKKQELTAIPIQAETQ